MKYIFNTISTFFGAFVLLVHYPGTVLAENSLHLENKLYETISKVDHRVGTEEADNRFDKDFLNGRMHAAPKTPDNLPMKYKSMAAGDMSSHVNKLVADFNANSGMQKSTFKLELKSVDKAGNLHISIMQYIKEIPVIDGYVTLHFDKNGELYSITGRYQQNEWINVSADISETQAIEYAKREINGEANVDSTKPELSIVGGRLVYLMKIKEKGLPGWWNITVDAKTGEVLEKQSSVKFLNPPGFPNNGSVTALTGNVCTHEGGGNTTVNGWQDNSTTPSQFYLFNNAEHWQVADSANTVLFHNGSNAWGTSNRPGFSLAANMNHIIQFVHDSLGINSFDNAGAMAVCWYPAISPVWGPLNAFWDGSEFNFGPGDGGIGGFEWVILDGVAHEFGHAITQNFAHCNGTEGGAINEAYSDILGACVEEAFHSDGRDQYNIGFRSQEIRSDWLICEDMFRSGGNRSFLRNMRDPEVGGNEGTHPSIYKGTYWDAKDEVHVNSTPLSHIFYLIAEGADTVITVDPTYNHSYGPFKGLGISAAREISWGSQIDGLLHGDVDYKDARNAWVHHALDLQLDAGIVAQAFAAGAVITRTVGIPAGTTLPGAIPNYSTITTALNAAGNHELIYVYPGSYNESFTINKEQIMLVGRDPSVTTINGMVTFGGNADDAVLTGFTINNATGAVTISASTQNKAQRISICGNVITGNSSVVNLSYAYSCNLLHNKISSNSGYSIVFANSTFNYIFENNISGGGITLGTASKANNFIGNVLDDIATDGVQINDNLSSNLLFSGNEFVNISGNELIQNLAGDMPNYCQYNIFSNPNGPHFVFHSNASGNFIDNSIKSRKAYLSMPTMIDYTHNYWDFYAGADLNADGYGDTELPAAGVDNSPRIKPLYTTFQISQNGNCLLRSSVTNFNTNIDAIRITGVRQSAANSGLKFGNNAGLTTNGNICGTQLIVNSDKWLSDQTNLSRGLVIKKPDGKVFMHISTDGTIKTCDKVLPNF